MAVAVKSKAEGVSVVEPMLVQLGFLKRAGDVFTLELGGDVVGWLGLNRASRHRPAGEVEINPVVGVRHQAVERVVADLRGEKFHGYIPPTVSTSLGYLMAEHRYRAWVFRVQDRADQGAEMVEAVATYAVPFMRRMTDLSALCEELDRGVGYEHQLVYRRPVAWMLLGNAERAHQVLEESAAKLSVRSDPAAEEFRRFHAALGQRLAAPTGEH
jgi:hypothetical protein